MKKIVFATGNENKMKEIRMILADLGMEIVSMREAGVDEEIVEDGMSFEGNPRNPCGSAGGNLFDERSRHFGRDR